MKNKVKIEGLDCPNCAKNLENLINDIDEVKSANIDFLKGELVFESKNFDTAIQKVVEVTKTFEPNAKIIYDVDSGVDGSKNGKEKKTGEQKPNNAPLKNVTTILDLTLLVVGIAIGLCVLFVDLPTVAFWILFVLSALLLGYRTYYKAIKLLFKGVVNENLLVTISVVGASIVGEKMEALMVIALYSIGKLLERLAVNKSRKSISELTKLQPEFAVVLRGNDEVVVKPSEVKVGDVIIVKAGEKVALDGVVIEGKTNLNKQSLTGESLPQVVCQGDEVISGAIVIDGEIKVNVTTEYQDSTVKKILDLIENAQEKKSKTETVISKVAKWYTLGVIVAAIVVWGIVWLATANFSTAIYRGLIFLVVSCPCAFAISVPLSYFSGIGNASKNGILIKGSNYLDACAKLNVVAFDKTGTLTTGDFRIEKVVVSKKGMTEEQLLQLAAIGESHSNHPLAKAIVSSTGKTSKKAKNIREIAGEGIYFDYLDKNYFIGRKNKKSSQTTVEVYENDKKIGEIFLADHVKPEAYEAVSKLKALGIKTLMLTGDAKESALNVATDLGVDDTKYGLLPQDKFAYVENLKEDKKNKLGFVGDGINDAPALSLSDVGISMGISGSNASIEASDIVLVDDNPAKVAKAVKISKYTRKIVWQNIAFSAIVKLTFLTLGAVGITGMLWAVFADVGVTVLAILNSLRAFYYKSKEQKGKCDC